MAQALTSGSLLMNANMQFVCTNVAADTSVTSDPGPVNSFSILPADASVFFHSQYTIGTSSSTTLTLSALLDKFGGSIAFTVVYGFLIQNMSTSSGKYVSLGAAAANPFVDWVGGTTPTVKIGPAGCIFLSSSIDGYTVTASSADQLKIANPSGAVSVVVKVTIIGK